MTDELRRKVYAFIEKYGFMRSTHPHSDMSEFAVKATDDVIKLVAEEFIDIADRHRGSDGLGMVDEIIAQVRALAPGKKPS